MYFQTLPPVFRPQTYTHAYNEGSGFKAPPLAARHRSRTRAPTDLEPTFFVCFPGIFEIGCLLDQKSEIRQKKFDLKTRRYPKSETEKKKGGKGPAQIPPTRKGQNPWTSGSTPVARGGCGGAPPQVDRCHPGHGKLMGVGLHLARRCAS